MKLDIDYELNYYDGPVEFFGALDDEPIYAVLVSEDSRDELRTFEYWRINLGNHTLAERLSAPASGRFNSDEVEPQI